ncbi:ATP-grasp domain-containing protein [Micromonospora sp. WMMD1128]|uniref:preATP grasp domain-containing protein n=1 Tax=Micromonospora sp. WMMD1128 TaxID=3015150 RepID=UPI00248D3499|nr:ATP-grasp domain-containing protein [Micromonospora sp. WMMD1128]WBB73942.1 ATP-grasp domain-containing protein [Micromonospora sp. WMMD1128]
MTTTQEPFVRRLRTALLGTDRTPLVFLGNFEVEQRWGGDEPGLPRVALTAGDAMVNRMDEFALLLAGPDDHVVLKDQPDPEHLAHLEKLGAALPHLLVTDRQDPHHTVTQDALDSPALLTRLSALAGAAAIVPHGVSADEEALAARTGVALAGSPAAVCKAVNGKIYSRRIATELGLRQSAGWTCETIEELDEAVEHARALLAAGRPVVLKDSYGVSGKGLLLIRDEARLDQIHRTLRRRADRSGDHRLALLVEEWVAKTTDLNYQFTVFRDGGVHFDFVKEAVTANGVHKGHRMPAGLTARQLAAVTHSAAALGARLARDGYHGVVGVDAMLDPEGGVYPVVEINARHNMSTYQVGLQEHLVPAGWCALARQYPLRLARPLRFGEVRDGLGPWLLGDAGRAGMVVQNFSTVNALVREGTGAADGRLYGFLTAPTTDELMAMDGEIAGRLAAVAEGTRR